MNDKTTLPVKRYRLLKDFTDPNGTVHAGVIKDTFQWMARFALLNESDFDIKTDWFELVIEQPDTKEKESRIKVGKFCCHEGEPGYGDMKWNIQFKTNKHIHYDKAVELCNLLERYLNGEMDNPNPSKEEGGIKTGIMSQMDMYQMGYKDGAKYGNLDKKYTKSELEEAESKAWGSAREYNSGCWFSPEFMKYPTIVDYRQSLNTINKEEKTKEQKDWEIQCIVVGNKNYWVQKNGLYHSDAFGTDYSYQSIIKWPDFKYIHSVKRLSDNQVFTVGDKASTDMEKNFVIKGFEIDPHDKSKIYVLREVVLTQPKGQKAIWRHCYIEDLKPSPLKDKEQEVLFTNLDTAYNTGIDHAITMVHGNFMLAGFDKEISNAKDCKEQLINQLNQLKKPS